MKRILTIMLLLFIALLRLTDISVSAQEPADKRKIESALLTTPDKCGELCIWTLQPGKQTLAEFQSFACSKEGAPRCLRFLLKPNRNAGVL